MSLAFSSDQGVVLNVVHALSRLMPHPDRCALRAAPRPTALPPSDGATRALSVSNAALDKFLAHEMGGRVLFTFLSLSYPVAFHALVVVGHVRSRRAAARAHRTLTSAVAAAASAGSQIARLSLARARDALATPALASLLLKIATQCPEWQRPATAKRKSVRAQGSLVRIARPASADVEEVSS
jgi:hypothetical protein